MGPLVTANFSGNVLFPANFTSIRLLNNEHNLSYAFDSVGSNLTLQDFDPALVNTSVVFVGGEDDEGGLTTFALTGRAVDPAQCIGNPPLCAWYVDGD